MIIADLVVQSVSVSVIDDRNAPEILHELFNPDQNEFISRNMKIFLFSIAIDQYYDQRKQNPFISYHQCNCCWCVATQGTSASTAVTSTLWSQNTPDSVSTGWLWIIFQFNVYQHLFIPVLYGSEYHHSHSHYGKLLVLRMKLQW